SACHKHRLRVLCVFCIFACHLRGQNQNARIIDSLEKVLLTAKEDTNKVKTLNLLAARIRSSKPQKGEELLNSAVAISEKLEWKKGAAASFNLLGTSKLY